MVPFITYQRDLEKIYLSWIEHVTEKDTQLKSDRSEYLSYLHITDSYQILPKVFNIFKNELITAFK